jgi:hypothetical protein
MKDKSAPQSRSSSLLNAIGCLILFGILVIGFYALSKSCSPCACCSGLQIFAVSVVIGLAALVVGSLLGFLFSIPRSGGQDKNDPYPDNSNLVDISDWLTKVLVGASLVTLTKIPPKLHLLADWIGQNGYNDQKDGTIFALALLIFFAVCGFLWMYVWTRLYFSQDLIDARSQTALLNAIKESPVANLLLRALSLPPTKQDDESKALRDQAKFMGESELSENPESRKIAIQYSRLLDEQFNDREEAIKILKETLALRRKNKLPFDIDDAALNFNLACYLNRNAKAENDAVRKGELRSEAIKLLREAEQSDSSIASEIKEDADLDDLTL